MEKSSLCRGQISTNFHSMGSYQFVFPSLSGLQAWQAKAGGQGPVICLSRRERRSGCNGASCTCSHDERNGEEIQGQLWVASACWRPCHPSQIKAIAAKPEELSERVGVKNGSQLHWEISTIQTHPPQSSGYPIWDEYGYTSSDLKSIVSCWCSEVYWLGWLHCIQSALNLCVSILWVSWTELAAAATHQKTWKRSKLSQLLRGG